MGPLGGKLVGILSNRGVTFVHDHATKLSKTMTPSKKISMAQKGIELVQEGNWAPPKRSLR